MSVPGDVRAGAPYGGRWLDGVFYRFAEPDAGLSAGAVRRFERWLAGQEAGAGISDKNAGIKNAS